MNSKEVINTLPEWAKEYINEIVKCFGGGYDFALSTFLVAYGGAIGNYARIKIQNGHVKNLNFYLALVGGPSSYKTPILNSIGTPIKILQKRLHEEATNEYYKLSKEKQKEIGFLSKTLFTTDSTMEALVDLLDKNPHGVIFWSDELNSMFASFNQYNKGKGDGTKILSLYDGALVYAHRKSNPVPVLTDDPMLSIIGGIQPAILKEVFTKNNGSIERFLFSCVDGPRKENFVTYEIPQNVIDKYVEVFISHMDYYMEKTTQTEPRQFELGLDLLAKIHKWGNTIPKNKKIAAALFKSIERIPKFALILQLLENPFDKSRRIQEKHVETAIGLAENFIANHLLISDMLKKEDSTKKRLDLMLLYFRKKVADLKMESTTNLADTIDFSIRTIYSNRSGGVPNNHPSPSKYVNHVLSELEILGYGQITKNDSGQDVFRFVVEMTDIPIIEEEED